MIVFSISSYLSGKSSVVDELPPETDIEPHINIGTKYQAICPNLEGSCNDEGSHEEANETSLGEKKVSSIVTARYKRTEILLRVRCPALIQVWKKDGQGPVGRVMVSRILGT